MRRRLGSSTSSGPGVGVSTVAIDSSSMLSARTSVRSCCIVLGKSLASVVIGPSLHPSREADRRLLGAFGPLGAQTTRKAPKPGSLRPSGADSTAVRLSRSTSTRRSPMSGLSTGDRWAHWIRRPDEVPAIPGSTRASSPGPQRRRSSQPRSLLAARLRSTGLFGLFGSASRQGPRGTPVVAASAPATPFGCHCRSRVRWRVAGRRVRSALVVASPCMIDSIARFAALSTVASTTGTSTTHGAFASDGAGSPRSSARAGLLSTDIAVRRSARRTW